MCLSLSRTALLGPSHQLAVRMRIMRIKFFFPVIIIIKYTNKE